MSDMESSKLLERKTVMNSSTVFPKLILLIILGIFSVADAQKEASLPIGLTPDEMLRLDEIGIRHINTAPPPPPVRNCAEWEPSEGVIIKWPLGLTLEVIAEFSQDIILTTIAGSSDQVNEAISVYSPNGVNMDNTEFIIAPTNSIWVRDYGPWFIFDGLDRMSIVDHIYNRPRPLDDQIPWIIGAAWGMDVYGMDLIQGGGNYMSDGLHISMSTELVYDENPDKTTEEIDSIMLAFTGNDYTVLDYIEPTGIHHIDCWAKFLNPTTILVKEVAPGQNGYPLLDDRAEFLSRQISSWNRPYTVVRVFCPTGTAYTNSIILNNKVLVPTFDSPYDDSALATYQEAMPGYEILGFWGYYYEQDAIHCRAMGVPDREMLFVDHIPLFGSNDTLNDYLIEARIIDYSNQGLIPESLKIFYRTDDAADFDFSYLNPSAHPDSFYGYIPAQPAGTEISYYLQAADSSGRVEKHPYIGAPWAHRFRIEDNAQPQIISEDSLVCATATEFAYYPDFTDIDDTLHQIYYRDYPAWLSVQNDSLVGITPEDRTTAAFKVRVADQNSYDEQEVGLLVYLCGDTDGDGDINFLDILKLIAFLYKGGQAPNPIESGVVDGIEEINMLDILWLVAYIYKGGPPPECL